MYFAHQMDKSQNFLYNKNKLKTYKCYVTIAEKGIK